MMAGSGRRGGPGQSPGAAAAAGRSGDGPGQPRCVRPGPRGRPSAGRAGRARPGPARREEREGGTGRGASRAVALSRERGVREAVRRAAAALAVPRRWGCPGPPPSAIFRPAGAAGARAGPRRGGAGPGPEMRPGCRCQGSRPS